MHVVMHRAFVVGRLLEQLIQRIAGALGHGLGGHSHRHLHRSAVGRAERRQGGDIDPVVQPALRLLAAELAADRLLGQRAGLGAVQLVGVIVGLQPEGGGVGLGNCGGKIVAVAVWNRFRQAQPEGSGAQGLA